MDNECSKNPAFRAGGLATAMDMLKLLSAFALLGYLFGGVFLFCIVVLTALVMHHKQEIELPQAINRLFALQRSVLNYLLTLSVAHCPKFRQSRKELQNVVMPAIPTPQKVVATMTLNSKENIQATQKESMPVAQMKVTHLTIVTLPAINLLAMETTEHRIGGKCPESKQVVQSRPFLQLKPKQLQQELLMLPKILESKATNVLQTKEHTKPQRVQKGFKPKFASKKNTLAPFSKPDSKVEAVARIQLVKVASPTTTVVVVPFMGPRSSFRPLIEVAIAEPTLERKSVFTCKVLPYFRLNSDLLMDLEEQELDHHTEVEVKLHQDAEEDPEVELQAEPVDHVMSLALPPLTQVIKMLPTTDIMEPNFLLDIELEPIFKQEKKIVPIDSMHHKLVRNGDLRMMLEELDVMQSELDAAMACCTLLLNTEEE